MENTLTVDPMKLVVMCYEGIINNLKIAKESHLYGKYKTKAKAIQKACDIINELAQSLNFEKGGEIAKNLDITYSYMKRLLSYNKIEMDIWGIDNIINLCEILKKSWEEAITSMEEIK